MEGERGPLTALDEVPNYLDIVHAAREENGSAGRRGNSKYFPPYNKGVGGRKCLRDIPS